MGGQPLAQAALDSAGRPLGQQLLSPDQAGAEHKQRQHQPEQRQHIAEGLVQAKDAIDDAAQQNGLHNKQRPREKAGAHGQKQHAARPAILVQHPPFN